MSFWGLCRFASVIYPDTSDSHRGCILSCTMLLFSVKRTSIKCPETDTTTYATFDSSFSILFPRFYQITNTVITNLVINVARIIPFSARKRPMINNPLANCSSFDQSWSSCIIQYGRLFYMERNHRGGQRPPLCTGRRERERERGIPPEERNKRADFTVLFFNYRSRSYG